MKSINIESLATSVHIHGFDKGFKSLIANLQTLEYEPGQPLFNQGEVSNTVYYIHDGATKIVEEESKQHVFKCLSGQGTIVGFDVTTDTCYHHSAIAITTCTVTVIPKLLLIEIIEENTEIGELLFNQLCEYAATVVNLEDLFVRHTPLQRTSCALILIQRALNRDLFMFEEYLVPMKIKCQDIAEFAHLEEQKTHEILLALSEYGVITMENQVITILDLLRLASYNVR